jgi:hypothetical protein
VGARHPIHGDFYRGNVLVDDGEIVAVIDWMDATLEPMEQEVAWSTWEFCRNEAGDGLIEPLAERFMRAYIEAGGPANVRAPFDPIPWIRRRLRLEASAWFNDPRSVDGHSRYHEAQVRAFLGLSGRTLPGRSSAIG